MHYIKNIPGNINGKQYFEKCKVREKIEISANRGQMQRSIVELVHYRNFSLLLSSVLESNQSFLPKKLREVSYNGARG